MWASLTDALSKTPMGVTAENLAEKYELTRQEVDEFALSSQKKWGEANQAGNFADEIAPMEIKSNCHNDFYLKTKRDKLGHKLFKLNG